MVTARFGIRLRSSGLTASGKEKERKQKSEKSGDCIVSFCFHKNPPELDKNRIPQKCGKICDKVTNREIILRLYDTKPLFGT